MATALHKPCRSSVARKSGALRLNDVPSLRADGQHLRDNLPEF
jgi:hypothetical protein